MSSVKSFISNFVNRSGNHIMAASIASRLLSFFASWIALQLIPDKNLGVVIYAFQITLFISPIANLGMNQSLIRYGSLLKTVEEKNNLFMFSLKKGVLFSSFIALILFLSSFIINFENPDISFYLRLLSLTFITQFIFQIIQIQFRLQKRNKVFAKLDIIYNLLLVVLVYVLSYYFNELGYALAILITPLLASVLFMKNLNINWKLKINFNFIDFSFWKYGLFASLATVTTTLLISIDILLIGYLMPNIEMVTTFKYVSLIPYSLIFLSQVVITTDFVEFTEKINDKKYIYNYIKNYMLLFSLISIGCLVVIFFLGKYLLTLFDPNFANYFNTLFTLTIGITGILIFRGIFGNLLSSIGKAHLNFNVTLIAVILNIVSNYYLIPKYGIQGAAITSTILMWFTGFLCMGYFFYYYKGNH